MTTVIEGAYFHDLLAQPDALRAVRQSLTQLKLDAALLSGWRAGKFARIVLTGMGSSLHAAYPLHRALSGAGFASHQPEAAELLLGFGPFYSPQTLLLAISQSGESAEVARLMERAGDFGHVVGITNNAASTLGRAAGTLLTLQAGEESTVSCKTYLSTLAVLNWLGAHVLPGGDVRAALDDLERAEDAVRDYLGRWRAHVTELLPLLDRVTDVFVTGRGDSLAAALTGGLTLKESTRLHAEGMSAAAFRHGPLEMAGKSVLVLIYEGDETVAPLHRRLAEDVARGGGRAVLISPRTDGPDVFTLPYVPPDVRPIVEMLPVQMLSLALAARGGFEAGHFTLASKITSTA